MKTSFIIIGIVLAFSFPVTSQVSDTVKFISLEPNDFHLAYLKDDEAILIDVREYFEFRRKRIRDAVNIPSSGHLEYSADTLDIESSLFLYCTSGYRSKRVARYFCDKGFKKVYSLEGGIVAWKKDEFPVVRKRIRSR